MEIGQDDFERIFKNHLRVENYSKPIDSLLSDRYLMRLNFSPDYQRNYVWDNHKATYFIESILLGTEIPPIVLFSNNKEFEVIDGRQRFETIYRFKKNEFSLTSKGLTILTDLAKKSYDDLIKKDKSIIDTFLSANIRIFEFALVNEPPLDKVLEDRVKKEIFSRYNTGITPLKKFEIENAIYDNDSITTSIKRLFKSNPNIEKLFYKTFFVVREHEINNPPIDKILQLVRKLIALPLFPIEYYAKSTIRLELLGKLYQFIADSTENEDKLIDSFIKKVELVADYYQYTIDNKLNKNYLISECLYWALSICEIEEIRLENKNLLFEFAKYASDNINQFNDKDYHYYSEVIARYTTTLNFFSNKLNYDLSVYINGNTKSISGLKEVQKKEDSKNKLSQLETLRLNKPDPVRKSIDDIQKIIMRNNFLLRPSYQRKEVINPTKATAIIESILLGISLPAIFVYKRLDGVFEVIDGQQRLLTILGFIGSEYIDENNKLSVSKNHKFTLRAPKILKELKGKRFSDLSDEDKDKILDFPLYLVEIKEESNEHFNPIDLFIRLNDKPYPIREHSFEMWNSWADYDIMRKIKNICNSHKSWFYFKQTDRKNDRDRMENEELLTSLVFLDFHKNDFSRKNFIVYQKSNRINASIGNKQYISQLLQEGLASDKTKNEILNSVKNVESFIKKLKLVLLDSDKSKDELFPYIKSQLELLLMGGKENILYRRTFQDFYILWQFLGEINTEMVSFNRLQMKEELKNVFTYIKNIPVHDLNDNQGYNNYIILLENFKTKYQTAKRKLQLTEQEKLELIKEQNNKCGISGAPIFLGDDIESDHTIPIAIGGEDTINNISIAHKTSNRQKGAKM
ncbi:MAG: DUF262 domain-containing protein [Flavobacterium sp.]|jgi:uncharacterized protein with ParB-like and HNH nuclease domain|nr:DUF262 domain-containing protein [Flavobacterium sp.]